VRAATGEPVRHNLDWFHLSMRMRPIEQVLAGLSERQEISLLLGCGSKIAVRDGMSAQESTNDLARLCTDLKAYVQNNRDAIINHHRRHHGKRPVSTSGAKGCVDEIVNARIGKKQRVRWSPPTGAHRVALIRAAPSSKGPDSKSTRRKNAVAGQRRSSLRLQ
jgi:hypothetical protein